MPKFLSRLPAPSHSPVAKVLLAAAVLCGLAALACLLSFSETTETSGHLWWRETRVIPLADRRPYLLAAIGLVVAAVSGVAGSLELCIAVARRTDAQMILSPQAPTSTVFVLTRAAGRAWRRARCRHAELLAASEARRAAAQEATARRHYERTTAGRAEMAYYRGDEFFSIDLDIDEELAESLNIIHIAGWRRHSLSRRHWDPRHGVQTQTFIFRRDAG